MVKLLEMDSRMVFARSYGGREKRKVAVQKIKSFSFSR